MTGFGGKPVEQPKAPRFGGKPVEQPKAPRFGGKLVSDGITGISGTIGSTEFKEQVNRSFDDDWDYTGIPRMGLRAAVSRGDTEEERAHILSTKVGVNNVTRDSKGRLGITAEGAKELGIDTKGKNLSLDGKDPFELEDIADLRGVAPEIAAGGAAALATGGASLVPSVLAIGGSAALAKGIDESADQLQGLNLQDPREVLGDIVTTAVTAGLEEVGGRALIRIGRKLVRPNARSLRDGAEKAIADANDLGIVPNISNLKEDPIFARIQGVLDTVLGDRNAARNVGAFKAEMNRLLGAFKTRVNDPVVFSQIMRKGYVEARQEFKDQAAAQFAVADKLLGNKKVIKADKFKQQADELLEAFAKAESTGERIAVNSEDLKLLEKLSDLEPELSAQQWQGYMTDLLDRANDTSPTPGISSGRAKKLIEALNESFEAAIKDQVPQGPGNASSNPFLRDGLQAMKDARKWYGENIQKFDNEMARTLSKPGSDIGGIPDDKVLDHILTKGSSARIKEIKGFLGPEKWSAFQSATMDRIFETQGIEDLNPLDKVFDGTVLRKSLNSFGRKNLQGDADRVLTDVLGADQVKALRKLATSMELAKTGLDKGASSGGLMAQAVAVRPIKNLGKIAQLVIMRRFLNNPNRLEWLTTGIRFGDKTEAGAKALARVSAQMTQLADDYAKEQIEAQKLEGSVP